MNYTALATRALSIASLVNAIRPILAQDAKVNVSMAFDGVPVGKNFDVEKVARQLKRQLKGKLAQDASMGQIAELLDMIDSHESAVEGDESVTEPQHKAMEAAAQGNSTLGIPEKVGKEFVSKDKARDWMKAKGMSEDDFADFEKATKEDDAEDEDMDDEGKKAKNQPTVDEENEKAKPNIFEGTKSAKDKKAADKAAKDKAAKDAADKAAKDAAEKDKGEMVSKGAMDAALKANEKLVTEKIMRTQHDIQDALRAVRPIVGELTMSFDSAEKVYEAVLKSRKIDIAGVDPSAFKAMVGMLPKANAVPSREDAQMAADSASTESLYKNFPGLKGVRVLG